MKNKKAEDTTEKWWMKKYGITRKGNPK